MPMRFTLMVFVLMLGILVNFQARAQSLQSVNLHGNNNTVIQIIIELSQGDPDWLRNNEARVTKLSERLGVSNALIVNFLGKIDQGDVSREKWPEILAKVADDYGKFLESAEILAANDPIAKGLIDKARNAAELAQFLEADRLLIEAEAQEEAAHDKIKQAERKRQLNLVDLKSIRAQNFMVQRKYMEAARLYEKAAALAEGLGREKQLEMLESAAQAYYRAGDEKGDNEALAKAAIVFRAKLLLLKDRERAPLDWAMTQNNLGSALTVLGGRETGTAQLGAAVAAFRAALTELPREVEPILWAEAQSNLGAALVMLAERGGGEAQLELAVVAFRAALEEVTVERTPRQWATTQVNLGNALWSLGVRDSGTARLKEAVEAFQSALKEWTREREPLRWAQVQINLGAGLTSLSERDGSTTRLEKAVEAFRAALTELSREQTPLLWAQAQNNLGNTLWTLGVQDSGTARLEMAVEAFRAALRELTPKRVPLLWAQAQNNLGNTLTALGQRENGTASLEAAVEVFQAALTELTRERVPLQWAQAQNNLGITLRLLGERKRSVYIILEAKAALQSAWDGFRAAGQTQHNGAFVKSLADCDEAIARLGP